jgi:hypothetical protein
MDADTEKINIVHWPEQHLLRMVTGGVELQ